eukprot:645089_1
MDESYTGYWGAPNSIIDFCEGNYVVSHYFAEFFNALSSIPMIIQAILGLVLTHMYATKENRFKMAFISLMFVGIGSTLFHASLRYKYQLLDELPMLIISTVLLYCALTLSTTRTKCIRLIVVQVTVLCLEILVYIYFQIWAIFFIGYSTNVVILTWYMFKYHLHRSALIKKFFIMGWGFYYGAFTCWCVDMAFCDYIQVLHLHSFWHLGAGYGSYLTLTLLIICRAHYLKKEPKVSVFHVSELLGMKHKNVVIDIPMSHYCTYHPIQED